MKRVVVPLAIVVLIAGAFAAGYLLRPAIAGNMAVQGAQVKSPPEWTQWKYPGSQEEGSQKGGGVQTNDWAVGPTYSVSLSTPDDLETVLKWYAKQFDFEAISSPTGSGSTGRFNTGDPDGNMYTNVVLTGTTPNQTNPVRTKLISTRTARYSIAVAVARNEGGSHTHILLTYFPNALLN